MSIKIQINSLEALERLIGGETKLEIDIRNSIVQEFTKKHLKGIAVDNINLKITDQIIEETEKHFFDITKQGPIWQPKQYAMKPHLKEMIIGYAKAHYQHALEAMVKESMDLVKQREFIKNLVEKQAKYIAAELTDKELESRLKVMVDARLKEKLGINK